MEERVTAREIRYRMTRAEFDVVSVFGGLLATEVPGPVFVAVLAHRGYSASSVRNQLSRMVVRGVLVSRRCGRHTNYRRAAQINHQYERLSGTLDVPEYTGSFPALIVTIPESDRSHRDRVVYLARLCGYRPVRAGVLIALDTPAADRLRVALAEARVDHDGVDACTLVPASDEQARAWVRRAFEPAAAGAAVDALAARVAAMVADPDLDQARYFDVFHALSAQTSRTRPLPRSLAPGYDADTRLADLASRVVDVWLERFAPAMFDEVAGLPEAASIEWDQARWAAVGTAPPDLR
ncbi:hypothetical protein Asera_57500 [Actinocatenispora sera]|uniref:PaaX family transcriptional regulator n=1 Tax=Actinocatenispora sera TaxID=390989 RepID=A0A810LAM8_9ACTN|nr:hypothetical protein Asera_57500 [Actinocatenispora sera]